MLISEYLDEETYALIFSSLKHSIRRKILRMLAVESMTFSEILDKVNIDSGHLSYHLESLDNLIIRSMDNRYRLSSFGEAAVILMNSVEGPTPRPFLSPFHTLFTKCSIFQLFILAITVAISSFFFMGENGKNWFTAFTLSLLIASVAAGYLPRRGIRVGCVNGLFASLLGGAISGLVFGVQIIMWFNPYMPQTISIGQRINWGLMFVGGSTLLWSAFGSLIGPIGGGLGGLIGSHNHKIKEPRKNKEED